MSLQNSNFLAVRKIIV